MNTSPASFQQSPVYTACIYLTACQTSISAGLYSLKVTRPLCPFGQVETPPRAVVACGFPWVASSSEL